jgi:hypothetical protein
LHTFLVVMAVHPDDRPSSSVFRGPYQGISV